MSGISDANHEMDVGRAGAVGPSPVVLSAITQAKMNAGLYWLTVFIFQQKNKLPSNREREKWRESALCKFAKIISQGGPLLDNYFKTTFFCFL